MAQTKKPQRGAEPTLRDRAEALRARLPDREADPVLDAIKEGRRLLEACRKARRLPRTVQGVPPAAENEATEDLFEHLREAIPQSPPETPIGGIALAKYTIEVQNLMGDFDISAEGFRILKLIAEVRLA